MVKSLRKLHEKHWLSHSIWMILISVTIMLIVSIGIKEYKKMDERVKTTESNVAKVEKRIDEVEVHFLSEQKVLGDKISELENKLANTENNVQKLNDDIKKKETERLNEEKKKKKTELKVTKSATNKSNGKNLGSFKVSHYTAYCKGCSGVTKTGINVKSTTHYQGMRIIAVDTRLIPLGSIVEINDNGKAYKAISLDTGGAIKGNKLDLLVGSKTEAYKLGVKKVDVKLIRSGW